MGCSNHHSQQPAGVRVSLPQHPPAAEARPQDRQVDAGGLSWHVQHRPGPGPGRPWLLLHGTGASVHSWHGLAPLLATRAAVWAVDLPGHGRSGALPAGQRSLPGMADALAALLHTLALQPGAVLGHSAGGALMLRLALDGGLTGARLVGLNAALTPFEGWAGFLFPPLARLLALNPLVPWLAAWRAQDQAAVRRLIDATGSRIDDEGVAAYARLLRNPRHVAGVLAMTANWDLAGLQRDLPRLQRPWQLLVGQADGTVPPAQAERLARHLPTVTLHRLPRLGHLAHEEDPAAVAQVLHESAVKRPMSPG